MGAAVSLFGLITDNVSAAARDRNAGASAGLPQPAATDLQNVTATMQPRCARKMTKATRIHEGPYNDADYLGMGDDGRQNLGASIFGDADDVLMFTVRSRGEPFVGKLNGGTLESQLAEVIVFRDSNGSIVATGLSSPTRLYTLYRRVLLVVPGQRGISHGHPISMIEMIFSAHIEALSPPNSGSHTLGDRRSERPFCSLPSGTLVLPPAFHLTLPAPPPDTASRGRPNNSMPRCDRWILLVWRRRDDDEYSDVRRADLRSHFPCAFSRSTESMCRSSGAILAMHRSAGKSVWRLVDLGYYTSRPIRSTEWNAAV